MHWRSLSTSRGPKRSAWRWQQSTSQCGEHPAATATLKRLLPRGHPENGKRRKAKSVDKQVCKIDLEGGFKGGGGDDALLDARDRRVATLELSAPFAALNLRA